MYNSHIKKNYFGIAALMVGILCVLSRLTQIGVAYLNITPETFGQLKNNLSALVYCLLTPSTLVLAVMGFMRKNDSKALLAYCNCAGVHSFFDRNHTNGWGYTN